MEEELITAGNYYRKLDTWRRQNNSSLFGMPSLDYTTVFVNPSKLIDNFNPFSNPLFSPAKDRHIKDVRMNNSSRGLYFIDRDRNIWPFYCVEFV